MTSILPELRPGDVLDIVLVATLVYLLLVALRQTRTSFLLLALLSLAATYVVALALGLRLTTFLFQVLFAAIIVGVLVMFHEEIRVSLERMFSWTSGRRPARPDAEGAAEVSAPAQMLVTVLGDLAKERIGALVVVVGKDDPLRHVHSGVRLDGTISEPLLKSIFDPHSIGHDGAVIVSGDRVLQFGAHLPLSADTEQLGKRGTRHAAALGLSSRTDSLCLVVSEERGVVSVAHEGELREMREPAELARVLAEHYGETTRPRRIGPDLLRRHLGLKLAALAIAALAWFLVVHEGTVEYRGFAAPIGHTGLAPGLNVSSVRPGRARVIVSGPRRSFYFVDSGRFRISIPLLDLGPGEHEIVLTANDLTLPDGVGFVNVVPRNVMVTIDERAR